MIESHPRRDRADLEFVGVAMSQLIRLPMLHSKYAIPIRVDAATPEPAGTRLFHLGPEPLRRSGYCEYRNPVPIPIRIVPGAESACVDTPLAVGDGALAHPRSLHAACRCA